MSIRKLICLASLFLLPTFLLAQIQSIFSFGKNKGWVTPVQQAAYDKFVAPLNSEQQGRLYNFIARAKTNSAKYFVLISWLCKDQLTTLDKFIDELNNYPESYQQQLCLMTSRNSIIQQWQNTCAVTVVQVLLGHICPRYAWDLQQTPGFNIISNNPANENAHEQKVLIEKYGVAAAVRGDTRAGVIPINGPLDNFVSPLLGVHYVTNEVKGSLQNVLKDAREQLDRGIDVPLLVGFVGTGARHFLLMMKYRSTGNGYEYLIYDPWDGLCDYVKESNMLQQSFYPLLTQWKISIDYYYLAR